MSLALVLPEEAVSGSAPVTFPGFPGVWTPGEPQKLAAFVVAGVFDSEEAAEAAFADLVQAGLLREVRPKKTGKPAEEGEG